MATPSRTDERAPAPARRPTARPGVLDAWCLSVMVLYVMLIAALVVVCLVRLDLEIFGTVFRNTDIRFAARLSVTTAALSAVLSLLAAVPTAYALSRYRFPGRLLVDTIVDIPIVLPPLVVGVALLVFFGTDLGKAIQAATTKFVYAWPGIVLSQFVVVSPYAVRIIKSAFDNADRRLEDVARTLGWSRPAVFLRVTLPMARGAIVAAGVVAWALAMGLFGPMMVFAGTTRGRTEVLATSIYLELSGGRIDAALAISMIMIVIALATLIVLKAAAGRKVLPW